MVLIKFLDLPTESHYEPTHRSILKWYRFISLILQTIHFLYLIIFIGGETFFLLLNYWCVFLTWLYFILVNISYKIKILRSFCLIFFEGIFPIDWAMTILFFGVSRSMTNYALLSVANTIPNLSVSIDFALSDIVFNRAHYWVPYGIAYFYVLLILIPCTFTKGEVYTGIDFVGWYTYVVFIGLVLVILVAFEIARFIRVRSCREMIGDKTKFGAVEGSVEMKDQVGLEIK